MLMLGHRGCRGAFTENTFAAFDHALESGCDGFEFDVRMSSDRVPVVWHDARLGGRLLSRQDWDVMRARCLNVGIRRRSIDLCELETVLARYREVAWMDIELKISGLEPQVVQLLSRYRPNRGFIVSSFRRRILLELHRIDPELPLGFIFDRLPKPMAWRELPVEYLKPSTRLVTPARVSEFHQAGRKVLTWTVNTAETIQAMAEAGVDGMIGDDPCMLAAER